LHPEYAGHNRLDRLLPDSRIKRISSRIMPVPHCFYLARKVLCNGIADEDQIRFLRLNAGHKPLMNGLLVETVLSQCSVPEPSLAPRHTSSVSSPYRTN
jgi:hypothetical protein